MIYFKLVHFRFIVFVMWPLCDRDQIPHNTVLLCHINSQELKLKVKLLTYENNVVSFFFSKLSYITNVSCIVLQNCLPFVHGVKKKLYENKNRIKLIFLYKIVGKNTNWTPLQVLDNSHTLTKKCRTSLHCINLPTRLKWLIVKLHILSQLFSMTMTIELIMLSFF